MKANEFKIGNLIYDFDEHTFYPIEEIKKNPQGNMCVIYRNGSFMSTDPIPMKLTEELLLKLGKAEIKPFGIGIEVFERFIFIWKESYKYWYVVTKDSQEYLTKIEFLHEYQNFIFALTNEELTLK